MHHLTAIERVKAFAAYAKHDPYRWSLIVGRRIVHERFGPGVIEFVNLMKVDIVFDEQVDGIRKRSFIPAVFRDGRITDVDVPMEAQGLQESFEHYVRQAEERRRKEEVAAEERRRREEADRLHKAQEDERHREELAASIEFGKLKESFGCSWYSGQAPVDPLFPILKSLQSGEGLSAEDEEWLRSRRLFCVMASYYESLMTHDMSTRTVSKASSLWRAAEVPGRAVDITGHALASWAARNWSNGGRAAVLTTRGGALRDVGKLEEAEEGAWEAHRFNPSGHHPFNLLGGIYYSKGSPEQGDKYFDEAEQRGASTSATDSSKRKALETSEPEARKRVAQYLLRKDLHRYGWARRYL